MVPCIYTKNASNLTNRYFGMVLGGQMDRRMDGRTTSKQYPSDFIGGKTSTKQRTKYHAQDYNTVFQVRLEPATPRSLAKHSINARLRPSAREHIL